VERDSTTDRKSLDRFVRPELTIAEETGAIHGNRVSNAQRSRHTHRGRRLRARACFREYVTLLTQRLPCHARDGRGLGFPPMIVPYLTALLLQTPYQQPGAIKNPASTSPATGDTVGYWQQRVQYRIVARLDEPATRLHSRGELLYVNNSPDTLREMYVHQYLNAFRPGSRWSADDEREGRVRFQRLSDPDFGYERFTIPPTVNGTPVFVDYPGAPDSTVAHFKLPSPLAPRDSVRIVFEWDARPSTTPRRQGRSGRTWDFAQWYPKVAVYDRAGWEPNPLRP